MRSSIARRSAVFGSAALLFFLPMGAAVHAEPAESPASALTESLPAEMVTALARDLSLTPEQYLTQSSLGQQLAQFAADARQRFPEVFAGTWLEHGQPIVALAPGADRAAAEAEAVAAGFTVREVAQSEQNLQSQIAQLDSWLDTQPPAIADLVRGITLDVVGNGLVLRTNDANGSLELPAFFPNIRILPSPNPIEPAPIDPSLLTSPLPGD
ncbi:MAG: protease, partial [Rhodococcus sp.]|nr:protease [Rhodococcus sp. (in: high G+C Gram-positive bacteria)]